jgi:hypothetical protein
VLSIVAAMVVVCVGLSACQVKVGKAAYIDKTSISENQVGDYVEANATTPPAGAIGAKTFVTQELVKRVILDKLATAIGGIPSDADLASLHDTALSTAFGAQVAGAEADTQLRAAVAERGLKPSFDMLYTRNIELSTAIGDYLQSATTEQQQKVQTAISRIKVRVNPRYGSWSTNNLALNGEAVPSWLRKTS